MTVCPKVSRFVLDPITITVPASGLAAFFGYRFATARGKTRPDSQALHEQTREDVRNALTVHQYQMDKALLEVRADFHNALDNLRRELRP